ncbi:DUF6426 family protein [Streptomyces sp. NPDC015171]|uniref:DUF6426 family protein n=1 Tax=Streptomyces sp. NPDC015171 TaxID=3364945 RepID=UPI0037015C44
MAVAAALGTAVLTAVPAVIAPSTAFACGGSTLCQDEDTGDEGGGNDDGGGFGGDWGGGDWGGGDSGGGDAGGDHGGGYGDYGDAGGGSGEGLPNVSEGDVGEPVDATLPTVVITGTATHPSAPASPQIPGVSWSGGGASPLVTVYREGRVWEDRQNCYANDTPTPQKISDTFGYAVSYEVSANISAKASDLLSATLGAKLNTTVSRSFTAEVTIPPGGSWAPYVEYQTKVYAVTTYNLFGQYTTEYVNVTAPTGKVTGRECR